MTGLRPFVAGNKSEHERNTDSNLTPSGNFHRRLHWVVTLLSPTKQFCEAGEGPCAELHQSSLHLTGPPRKGDDLET